MQNRIRLEHKGRDMANHCKVFTTSAYAKELLDAADYRCGLFGRRVLENSCGDGHILMEIVRRYISDCIDREMPLSLIKTVWSGTLQDTNWNGSIMKTVSEI